MNIFIAEDNLQDYLYLRRIIEKWSKWRNEPIHIYYHNVILIYFISAATDPSHQIDVGLFLFYKSQD